MSGLSFEGQVVLVTGAAQGIGFAIARAFQEHGASVALNDLAPDRVEAALARLGGPSLRLAGAAADVSQHREVARLVATAMRAFGRLDIVVNNAGLYPVTPVLEMTEEEWDRVLDVNLKGTFLVSQLTARQMVTQGSGGQIVNISSGSYKVARLGCAHYCASKAGVVMLTRVLAMELAPHHIRVNSIAPGLIDVPEAINPTPLDYAAAMLNLIPAHRLGTPEDIANAVLLLCSPEAEYISGAVLAVDGGLSAGRMPPATLK